MRMAKTKALMVFFLVIISCACNFLAVLPQSTDHQVDRHITWSDLRIHGRKNHFGPDDKISNVIVVNKYGKGHSTTVQGAVDMVPDSNLRRVKIYIYPGIYREKVHIPSTKPYISFIGKKGHMNDTVITWNDQASTKANGAEIGTFRSASVTIESDYFCATGITFQNTVVAAPGEAGTQAVALRVSSKRAFFYKVRIIGSQDTLLSEIGTHYFYKCYIEGSIDFIFGQAKALFQSCVIQSTAKTFGAIAAHRRSSPSEDSGFSFVTCVIKGTGNIFLGRAWGPHSLILFSYCNIDDIILLSGWSDMNPPHNQKSAIFGEFKNTGKGANTTRRVSWKRSFSYKEIRHYLGMPFIDGHHWLKLG